jgi:predicted NAD-dependent protein-ADP-ribosyltransferase YbiA (DUF1768 family)
LGTDVSAKPGCGKTVFSESFPFIKEMSDNNNRAPYAEESDIDEEEAEEQVEDVPLGPTEPDTEEPTTIKRYLHYDLPYPKETAAKMNKFYIKRNKNPTKFTYSETGDLIVLGQGGEQDDAIALKTYVPYSASDWVQRDELRDEVLLLAETKYDEAMQELQSAISDASITGAKQQVLAAQLAVADADAILSRVRYGTRGIQGLANPETRDVMFDDPYESRKLLKKIVLTNRKAEEGEITELKAEKLSMVKLCVREFPYYTFYGNYVEGPAEVGQDVDGALDAAPEVSEASVRQRLRDGRWARIFLEAELDNPNGFLSPFWPVDFTFGDTLYSCALQAYEAERARELKKDALRAQLLVTRSPRTIRHLVKKLTAQPKDPKGLWLRILTALYQQHAVLKAKLLATGTDALVFADPVAGPLGVGFSPRESAVLDPTKWKSINAVGVALETLRIQIREGTAREAPKNTAPTQRAITVEEQEAAKTGAIIQAKKKFQFKRPGAGV